MRRTSSTRLVCTAFTLTALAATTAYGTPPPDAPLHPWRGTSYMSFSVPHQLTQRDLDACASVLVLSDAQCAILNRLAATFREQQAADHERYVQPLWERAAHAMAVRDAGLEEDFNQLALELTRDSRTTCERLHSKQQDLLTAMEPFLAEPQLVLLPRARNWLTRRQSRIPHAMYPAGDVDLLEYLRPLIKSHEHPVLQRVAFDALYGAYDVALTELFRRQADVHVRLTIEGRMTPDYMHNEEFKRRFSKAKISAARRIHDLNAQFVEAFSSVLAPDIAEALRRQFREIAYWEAVYPDPSSVSDLLAELVAVESLSEEHRDALRTLMAMDATQREAINEKMTDRYLRWYVVKFSEWSRQADAFDAYAAEMLRLNESRVELARIALDQAEAVLAESADTVEQVERIRARRATLTTTSYHPDRNYARSLGREVDMP